MTTAAQAIASLPANPDWTSGFVTISGALRAEITGDRAILHGEPTSEQLDVVDKAMAAIAAALGLTVDDDALYDITPEQLTSQVIECAAGLAA
ncbi:MAG: hypothetical protein OEW44_00060 [Gemmatimonadota bacterium]|nr:hypothetical protein [Gemmatimonadota bacterium]